MFQSRVRIDRNELSGAFGDIGTDLPLMVGILLVSGLDPVSVFVMFGVTQIFSGLFYGIPMPVQPLKAVAVMAISQHLGADMILAAGIGLGVVMLFLNITGLIKMIYDFIPTSVVRGIQFGLGLNLLLLALTDYIPSQGLNGMLLSAAGLVIVLLLLGNRRYPPALAVILLGLLYSLIFNTGAMPQFSTMHISLPQIHELSLYDILTGFLVLGLPQLPLSVSNSLAATKKLADDLFPEKKLSVKKLANTYSIMNIVNPLLGGIPVCHGSGGLAGHYAFGGRTGGTLLIYGSLYLLIAFFLSGNYSSIQMLFPLPVLGVILSVEGFSLAKFIRKTAGSKELLIALTVGFICVLVTNGYVYGLLAGTLIYYLEPIARRSLGVRNEG
jgi:MFS superfamily sulfate permease-like transporter